jgi:hydrogenase maturation protease
MNPAAIDKIVEAVLYEGYMLYPYRPSVKNRQRWTFGGIYPPAWVQDNPGSDASRMQAEVLVRGNTQTVLRISVRCLHLMARWSPEYWQEAVERRIEIEPLGLAFLQGRPHQHQFSFPHDKQTDADGTVREQQAVSGWIEISSQPVAGDVWRVRAAAANETDLSADQCRDREEAVMRSLAATNIVLAIERGQFVSATDPPEELRQAAAQCQNVGCWPVLLGQSGDADAMLASPIILYDHPQLAPESPGNLFDGTEIDEILTLRILTMTDEEKRQAGATDERVRQMLARTESLARSQLSDLHGAIRGLRPVAPSGARLDSAQPNSAQPEAAYHE